MARSILVAAASLVAMTVAAQAGPERVRGTIESVSDSAITVKTADGTKEVALAPDTKFVWVVSSSLDEVKDGKFIGTATKGENPPTALEVVVFPASMNGTAEGHYAWDSIEDKTGGGLTKSKMTNGTIKSSSSGGGDKMITVTYDNGQELKIAVPPSAPIVAFDPADKTIVTKGSTVFAVAVPDGGKLDAKLVAIGKGDVKPPM